MRDSAPNPLKKVKLRLNSSPFDSILNLRLNSIKTFNSQVFLWFNTWTKIGQFYTLYAVHCLIYLKVCIRMCAR